MQNNAAVFRTQETLEEGRQEVFIFVKIYFSFFFHKSCLGKDSVSSKFLVTLSAELTTSSAPFSSIALQVASSLTKHGKVSMMFS